MSAIIFLMEPSRTGRALARQASDLKAIGRRLVVARLAKRLLPSQVISQTGLTSSKLSNWEGGSKRPSIGELALLLPLLEISSDYVYFGIEAGLTYETREALAQARERQAAEPEVPERKRGRPKKAEVKADPTEISPMVIKKVA